MALGEWLPVSLHLSHPRVNTHSRPLYPAWLHALPRVLWNKPVSNNLYFPRQPKTFLHFLTFHSFTQQTLFSPRKFPKTLEERMRDTHGLQNTVGRRSHCHYLGKQHREPGRAWRRPGKAESRPKEEGQTHQPPPVLSLRKSGCRKRGWGEHPLPQPSCSDRPLSQGLPLLLAQRILAPTSGTSQTGQRAGGFGHCPPRVGSYPAVLSRPQE